MSVIRLQIMPIVVLLNSAENIGVNSGKHYSKALYLSIHLQLSNLLFFVSLKSTNFTADE